MKQRLNQWKSICVTQWIGANAKLSKQSALQIAEFNHDGSTESMYVKIYKTSDVNKSECEAEGGTRIL